MIEIIFSSGKIKNIEDKLADFETEDLESREEDRIKDNFVEKDSKGNAVVDENSFPFSS